MARKCHGKNKIATAKQNNHGKTKKPQQNKKPRQSKNHDNTKNPRKMKNSRQNKIATAKQKSIGKIEKPWQNKRNHGKTKRLRQNEKARANTVFGILSMNISQYLIQVLRYVRKITLHPLIIY